MSNAREPQLRQRHAHALCHAALCVLWLACATFVQAQDATEAAPEPAAQAAPDAAAAAAPATDATLAPAPATTTVASELPAAPAPPAPPAPPPPVSSRQGNAAADRVVLMPTGDTQPQGTLYFTDYDIVLLQAGYAPTDKLNVTLTGFTDFGHTDAFDLALKASVHRSPLLRVAALAAMTYLHGGKQELLAARAGGALQLCFEPACRSSATLSSFVGLSDLPDVLLPVAVAMGIVARVTDEIHLLAEYSTLFNANKRIQFIDQSLFILSYGLRLTGNAHWALDTCFMRSMESTGDHTTAPFFRILGIPLLAFTYRFQLGPAH